MNPVTEALTLAAPDLHSSIAPDAIVLRGAFSENLTEDEFFDFCQQNPTLRIERLPDQTIALTASTGIFPGARSGEAFLQLGIWHRQHETGLLCDSSTGFTLPDKSVRSPDASWLSAERLATVPAEDRERPGHVCPDFVIEVQSPNDSLRGLQAKMMDWIANGVRLGFLISPPTETAWVYRADGTVSKITDFEQEISGEDVLPGFRLELHRLRRR